MQFLSGLLNALPNAVALGLLFGVMAIGVYITFRLLDFADLTVDGSFAMGGAICAVLIVSGWHPLAAALVSMLAGMVAGFATGLLHTLLRIPKILSGILMMIALYSVNLRIMGQANTPMLNKTTLLTLLSSILPIHKNYIWILIGVLFSAVIIAVLYWFFGTEVGCAVRATGNNEAMIRALGGNTNTMKIIGLMISNSLVALSGALVAQSQGYANVTMGTGTIMIGLAAVIIGEVVFCRKERPFVIKLAAICIGAVIYRVVIAIVLQLGLNTDDMKLFTAILVALAMSVPVIKDKIVGRRKKEAV